MDEISNGRATLDPAEDEDTDDTWRHPSTLGLMAFALAVLSLLGAAVFRGVAYTLAFVPHNELGDTSSPATKGYLVAGAFLSAAFALLPAFLARAGLARLVPSDAAWTGSVLRAAFALALISLALHLVLALVAMQSSGINGLTFFSA